METERICQIALTIIPDIGSITARKLIAWSGSAEDVFREKRSSLLKIPGIGQHIINRLNLDTVLPEVEKEIEFIERNRIQALSYQDKAYPDKLRNCVDGPVILYKKGQDSLPDARFLSVVGTRNASPEGRELCRSLVTDLASRFPELIIVSGLAYGIDIVAHRTALEQGLHTLAVLAHGLHTIYPAQHRDTAARIIHQGALLTDFTTRSMPERNNFLRRNRIIAGLSEATLIIESGEKGGAMITAELAASYNRDVFAVPGRVFDNHSKGCNLLIKKNIAALVENVEDIANNLGWGEFESTSALSPLLETTLNTEEEKILRLIDSEKEASTEFISIRTGIPVHKCISLMVTMELRGWLLVLPGNIYRLKVRLPY